MATTVVFGPVTTWDDERGGADRHRRVRIPASALSGNGSLIRVTIRGGVTEDGKIDDIYIGHHDPAGSSWAMDGNQVRLTWGGNNNVTAPQNDTIESDIVSFALDSSRDLIVSWDQSSDTTAEEFAVDLAITGYTLFYKLATDAAADDDPAGLTATANRHGLVHKIEVITSGSKVTPIFF